MKLLLPRLPPSFLDFLLPSSNNLPTDAELECSWGDGTTFKALVGIGENQKIKIRESRHCNLARSSYCCVDPVLGC